jgi:hypothetical protein
MPGWAIVTVSALAQVLPEAGEPDLLTTTDE